MPHDIPPEAMKAIRRQIWLHAALTTVLLAFLGYVVWRLFTDEPLQLLLLAATLVVLRELFRGFGELYEHWVKISSNAHAAGLKRWWRLK